MLLDFAGVGRAKGGKRAGFEAGGTSALHGNRRVGHSQEGMVHGPLLVCAALRRAVEATSGLVPAFFLPLVKFV